MAWTTLRRILRTGLVSFVRNGIVSVSAVLNIAVTLFLLCSLILLSAVLTHVLADVRNKVDINVYFIPEAPEESVLSFKERLEQLPEVERISYVSRDEALTRFVDRHAGDQLTLQALEEVGGNPFGALLEVKAKDPSQYESIARYLDEEPALAPDATPLIDRVNYFENKVVIDRLGVLISAVESGGLLAFLVLSLSSILIIFTTIRLAIYNAREQIGVMRLVGASNMYVRGPFIVEGALAGAVAGVMVLILMYPIALWLSPYTASWFSGFSLAGYYGSHIHILFMQIVGTGVLLGALSSFLAVQRYLRV